MNTRLFLILVALGASATAFAAGNIDKDQDGYFADDTVPADRDCNDDAAGINPGANEVAGNTVDENCDNVVAPAAATVSSGPAPDPIANAMVPDKCWAGVGDVQEARLVSEYHRCEDGGGTWETAPGCTCVKQGMVFADVVNDFVESPIDGHNTKIYRVRELVTADTAKSALDLARLKARTKENADDIAALETALAQETADRKAGDDRLQGEIDQTNADVKGVVDAMTAVVQNDAKQDGRINTLEIQGVDHENRIGELEKHQANAWFGVGVFGLGAFRPAGTAPVENSDQMATVYGGSAGGIGVTIEGAGPVNDRARIGAFASLSRVSEAGNASGNGEAYHFGSDVVQFGPEFASRVSDNVELGGMGVVNLHMAGAQPGVSRAASFGGGVGGLLDVGIDDTPLVWSSRLVAGVESTQWSVNGSVNDPKTAPFATLQTGLTVRF